MLRQWNIFAFKLSASKHLSASKYEVYLSFGIGYGEIWGRVTLLFFKGWKARYPPISLFKITRT